MNPRRAATTDDYCGPAEGEQAFVAGLCGRLKAELGAGAMLADASREKHDGTTRLTIVASEPDAGLAGALEPGAIGRLLREKAHAARKQELESGPLFGREAGR